MKTFTRAIVFGPLIAAAMFAQRPFGVLTSAPAPDPATMIQNKVERLTALLSLTTDQAAQATTIFTAAQTAITPLETSLAGNWTSMQAAVKSNATATIDQLAGSIGTATGQVAAIRNKADAAFYSILTADQRTRLDSMPGAPGRGPGGPGPRMRGGPIQ